MASDTSALPLARNHENARRQMRNRGSHADLTERYALFEGFERLPLANSAVAVTANLDFEALGTNLVTSQMAFASTGGVTLTTDTATPADGDSAFLVPHNDTEQTAWRSTVWRPDADPRFDLQCLVPSFTNVDFICGLVSADPGLTDDDTRDLSQFANAAFFAIVHDNDVTAAASTLGVNLVTSVGGVDTIQDAARFGQTFLKSLIANTDALFGIQVRNNKPHFYINGDFVGAGAEFAGTEDLHPAAGLETDTTTAANFSARWARISKDFS